MKCRFLQAGLQVGRIRQKKLGRTALRSIAEATFYRDDALCVPGCWRASRQLRLAKGERGLERRLRFCSLALRRLFREKTLLSKAASLSPSISAKYVSIKK